MVLGNLPKREFLFWRNLASTLTMRVRTILRVRIVGITIFGNRAEPLTTGLRKLWQVLVFLVQIMFVVVVWRSIAKPIVV